MAAVPVTVAILSIGCSGGAKGPEPADAFKVFTAEVVNVLTQIRLAQGVLSDPAVGSLTPSEREQRYAELEEEMRQLREGLDALDVPEQLREPQRRFTSLLVKERDIWVHMVLYVRTGQELHRALANELLVDSQEEIQTHTRQLQGILEDRGGDMARFGLDAFLAPGTPTPTPGAIAPTVSPTTSPTASPVRSAPSTPTTEVQPEPTPTPRLHRQQRRPRRTFPLPHLLRSRSHLPPPLHRPPSPRIPQLPRPRSPVPLPLLPLPLPLLRQRLCRPRRPRSPHLPDLLQALPAHLHRHPLQFRLRRLLSHPGHHRHLRRHRLLVQF